MHVVFGFDYILEYGYDTTRFLRTNLSNWDHIIFIDPKGSNNARIKVKLITFEDDPDSINFNDEPNMEKREMLMKVDDLLDDNQVLTANVSKLRDDLSDRERYIDKLKSQLEWQKIMFDVIQDMYKSLIGESKETKGDN